MECTSADDSTTLRVASFACYLDTAKDTLVHKISAQDNPIVLNPSAKPKPPLNANVGLANLRVDSFSYLNTSMGDHGFMFNVPKPIHSPSNGFTFPKEVPKDGEISVFGADKYFNAMKLEYQDGIGHEKKQVPINLPRVGSNPRVRPSNLCSESSSLNSRTALLVANSNANGSTAKHRKAPRRCFFFRFGCQGPCFDKKGISLANNETCNPRSNNGPVSVQIPNPSMGMQLPEFASIDESRTSIEVFGSAMTSSKGDVAANLERKLSMLTWDAIPKSNQQIPPPTASTVRTSTICDDMASDASSDLFEIENITGSMFPMVTTSGAADADVSNCPSPVSHYAPSEASIQWSVVTASAADYASVLSDYNEAEIMNANLQSKSINSTNVRKNKEVGQHEVKARAGGLLGCKSQKAVDVAENQYVCCKSSDQKAKNLPAVSV